MADVKGVTERLITSGFSFSPATDLSTVISTEYLIISVVVCLRKSSKRREIFLKNSKHFYDTIIYTESFGDITMHKEEAITKRAAKFKNLKKDVTKCVKYIRLIL